MYKELPKVSEMEEEKISSNTISAKFRVRLKNDEMN